MRNRCASAPPAPEELHVDTTFPAREQLPPVTEYESAVPASHRGAVWNANGESSGGRAMGEP